MPKTATTPTAYTKDLAIAVAESLKIPKTQATQAVEATIDAIVVELMAGNKINIAALGIFQVKNVAERKCRNPHTGEQFVKPPYKKLTFRPTKAMKTRLS
jgi:nucleoid DNA-binding protein